MISCVTDDPRYFSFSFLWFSFYVDTNERPTQSTFHSKHNDWANTSRIFRIWLSLFYFSLFKVQRLEKIREFCVNEMKFCGFVHVKHSILWWFAVSIDIISVQTEFMVDNVIWMDWMCELNVSSSWWNYYYCFCCVCFWKMNGKLSDVFYSRSFKSFGMIMFGFFVSSCFRLIVQHFYSFKRSAFGGIGQIGQIG